MQNPYDINSNADAALMGGTSADSAAGFPTPQPRAGLRPTGSAILAESQARLAAMQAPAPKPRTEPMVGYNTQTKTIFSGGRTYEAGNLGSLAQAQQHGALDIAEQQFPEGYEPMPAAAVRQKLAAVPDWKKEMGSSLRNYGANMALVGGAVTGSQGMMDTYGRLNAESEALAQQSAAPKQWDDVEFGKNMLPYVRQLGIQSVPYIAEAMVTGFGLGSALKGVGVQAAKATAEKAILAEAAKLVAKTTVGGVARMSQEQALMQAASTVGNTFARSAGMAMGTYPSAVGDVLSNQMEQTGKIDGTSAALLGVPYAGLNLLGGTGLISGTGRAIERGLGTSVMGNAARAGTAAGITVGGEVVNEVGQEMLNQAGRIAVDPNASMFSPEATARYKESAIGGALLGGFGGAVAGAQGYMRPAEQAVTPQLLDQNDQAQMARYETDYAREGMVRDQAAGAGGPNFQGPMPGAPVKPEVVAPTAEEELAAQKLEDTFKAIGIGKGKKKRAIATEAVDAGIDLESETADQLVKLLKGNKLVAAQAELEKLKNDSTSGLSGAGDATLGDAGGVEPAGGVDAGLPVADGGAGGTGPSAGEPAVGVQPPVAGGDAGLPTAPVKAVIPDFSLEAPSGAPSATYMEQNPSVEPEPAKQTDNLSLKNQKDTGQVPLFEPEVKRKRVLKAKDLTPTRAAVNVGGPVAPVQEERSEAVQAKQLKKTHEAMAAVEAAKPEEQRAAEAKQEAAEKTSIPPVEEFSKVYGDIAGRRAHAAASGETWASIAKREGVTEKAIRNMVNRLKGDKAGPEVRAALDIAQKKAVERRNKAAIASEGGDSSAVDVSAESEQVQELLAGEGMQVKSAESTGVKETEAEGGFSAKETKLLAQMDKLQKAIKEAKAEGDTATAARLKTELDVAAKRFAAEQEKYFVVTDETSISEDTTEELGSDEMLWSDDATTEYYDLRVGQLVEEAPRVPVVQAKAAINRALRAWDNGGSEGHLALDMRLLADRLEQQSAARRDKEVTTERTRGAQYVRERLLQAARRGDIDSDTQEFADWLLRNNPQMANNLGISVRTGDLSGAGRYTAVSRVMTLFSSNTNVGTAVHEILHHTERMMPSEVQAGIRTAWSKAVAAAVKNADEKTRGHLTDLLNAGYDKPSAERTKKAFASGDLSYDKHYQLANPSEFWAVNGTRILQGKYDATTWTAKAVQWVKEMLAKVKSILGARSDTAVYNALRSLAAGDGSFVPRARMLGEVKGGEFADISAASISAKLPAPLQEELDRVDAALRKIQGDFKAVLQYAIDNEANPARKATMEKVMARYVQLAKLGFDFSFAVTPVGRGYRNMQGLSTYTPGSLGSASKIKVELNGADWGANAGTSQETLAH